MGLAGSHFIASFTFTHNYNPAKHETNNSMLTLFDSESINTASSDCWVAMVNTFRKRATYQASMEIPFELPDLNRTFCNFELGLDAEQVRVTDIPDDQMELLQNAIPSDSDIDEITIRSDSPSTTLPPNIEYSSSSSNDHDTDLDINTPQNMKGLRKNQRRRKRVREALIKKNRTNNPNPFSATHKAPTTEEYNRPYKKCPWHPITVQRPKLSYDMFGSYLCTLYYNVQYI